VSGSSRTYPPHVTITALDAAAARTLARTGPQSPLPRATGTEVPLPPISPAGISVLAQWPLRDFLELGALPSAVPCARLHAKHLIREWGFRAPGGNTEILVSELVTNAIHASGALGGAWPVRLWLLSDRSRLLVIVWDVSPELPVRADVGLDAESGRGLLLVEMISDQWGTVATPPCGKTVWALTATP